MNMMKSLIPLIVLLICACNGPRSIQNDKVLTVEQLIDERYKYASRILDVRGEIVMDYHGPALCDESGTPCFFVIPSENIVPKPDFELHKDHLYEEYRQLSIKIGLVQKKLGKAKLLVTLRGRFDNYILLPNGEEVVVKNPKKESAVRCRFVLQRVLKLDVQKLN
jgi:hypothetical protein